MNVITIPDEDTFEPELLAYLMSTINLYKVEMSIGFEELNAELLKILFEEFLFFRNDLQ